MRKGQYIRNAAIHDTYNRCVTVHGTNNLQVENNVTYNTVGHCFFLEDGIETGNQYIRNLAIQTKCHTSKPCDPTNLAPFGATAGTNFNTTGQDSKDVLIPSDNTVSSFWITNPDNIYRDNVAAGSDATGFWFAFPEHPTGKFEGTEISKATWPRRTKVREFKGNVAHSNFDSFMGDRAPRADGHFAVGGYISLVNPADANSAQAESVVEDFTSYKNRNSGIWARGELRLYKNLKMADNGIGFTQASGNFGQSAYTSRVVDSRFVGETENIGNPRTPAEMAYGRSLPQPEVADFPIRAYEFYDYHHELDNNTFVNYQDNATRKTGAISYLLFTSFGMSSNNTVQRSKFINAKPVYFPPIDNRWSNDDYGNTVYKTSVFNDKDGTITGVANSYIVNITGIDVDEACEVKPTWNAVVCKGDIGRMNVGGGGGAVRVRRRRRSSCRWSRCRSRTRRSSRPWRRRYLRTGRSCWSWRRCPRSRCCCTCCLCYCPRWWSNQRYRCTFRAASRSQPQWQGVHRQRGNQRTSGHRVQGDHRKAVREHQREGTGCRFVGDVRAAGIHHRSLGYGAGQPGCAAQGQRHLVLQGQRFALGQARLHR